MALISLDERDTSYKTSHTGCSYVGGLYTHKKERSTVLARSCTVGFGATLAPSVVISYHPL